MQHPTSSGTDTTSMESSFSDSDVFTKPTIRKYLIKQVLLLHWRRLSRLAFILNALYSVGWLLADLFVLRRKEIHNSELVTRCGWHGIAIPVLQCLASLIGIIAVCSVKEEGVT